MKRISVPESAQQVWKTSETHASQLCLPSEKQAECFSHQTTQTFRMLIMDGGQGMNLYGMQRTENANRIAIKHCTYSDFAVPDPRLQFQFSHGPRKDLFFKINH